MSVNTKLNRSIRKKGLTNTRQVVAGVSSLKFHHQANIGETLFDLTNLNVPAGLSNPSPTALGKLKIKQFSENFTMVSNLRGLLMEDISYEMVTDQSLKLIGLEAIQDEVFSFTHFNHQTNGALLVDARPDGSSGLLLEDQTDFALGTPVLIEDLANQWPIQVFRNGTPMLRNVGNGTSDGNYQMLDNGDGYCSVIRFNIVGDVGDEPVFWSTNGALAERPNDSVLQRVDKLHGIVDTLRDDAAEAFGFDITDPTRYNGGIPTQPDLRAFGDKVQRLEKILNLEIPMIHNMLLLETSTSIVVGAGPVPIKLPTSEFNALISNGNITTLTATQETSSTRFTADKACWVALTGAVESAGVTNESLEMSKNGVRIHQTEASRFGAASIFLNAGDWVELLYRGSATTVTDMSFSLRTEAHMKISNLI